MSDRVEWSELPEELLPPIGKGLDILRFRSVCKSWRSGISCTDFVPRFPFNFPNPLPAPPRKQTRRGPQLLSWMARVHAKADHRHLQTKCLLHETILYHLTPSASDKG